MKKVPFLRLNVPIKRAKKVCFFAVGSDVLTSAKKEPLKINSVFKLNLKAVSNSTDFKTDVNHLVPFVLFELTDPLVKRKIWQNIWKAMSLSSGISLKTIKRTNMSVKFSDKTFQK